MNTWLTLFDRRGFQTRLARRLGLSKSRINGWRKGIPIPYCVAVEEECGGEFTRLDFRPDDGAQIWPEFARQVAEARAAEEVAA